MNTPRWLKYGLFVIVILALLFLLAGCSSIRCNSPTVVERTVDIGDEVAQQ